jgi:hypothetical protein
MGADQHLDPDDRTELAVVAYNLYGKLGSLSQVREHLATHPTTLRLLGGRRLFSRATIKEFLDDGRTAERYVDLLKLQDARADSDTRLSLLGSIVHEWMRLHPAQNTDELMKMVLGLLKIEQARIGLNGWAAPARVAHSLDPGGPALPPEDMVRAIAKMRAEDAERRRAVIATTYPDATVVPARRSSRRRPTDEDRRTS